jgi:two-component system, sensor histidine kinase RpfC
MNIWAKIRRRIYAAGKKNPSENATYRNRLALLATFWLAIMLSKDFIEDSAINLTILAWGHLLSIGLTILSRIWFVLQPERRDLRLIISIAIDCLTASIAVAFGGIVGVPFVFAYLWASFGNGFRFGVTMLRYGAVIGFGSFFLVAIVTPYWRDKPEITLMVMTILLILPAYAAGLINRLEQAIAGEKAASGAKSKFLAMMSHELRTPLNSIINLSLMMPQKGNFDDDQKAMAMSINQSGETLLEMVDNILIVSKAEEQAIATPAERVDLFELLRTIDLGLRPLAFQKKLNLQLRVDSGLTRYVESTSAHLKKILLNLGGNAIKFTKEGSVSILLERWEEEDQEFLHIKVSDTGSGIPKDRQEAIFQRFAQLENAKANQLGGVGLGLAICADLAAAMGGRIWLESEEGKGACFCVIVPLTELEDKNALVPVQSSVYIYGDGDSHFLELALQSTDIICTRISDDMSVEEFADKLTHDAALVFVQGKARSKLPEFMRQADSYQKSILIEVLDTEEQGYDDFPYFMTIGKEDDEALGRVLGFAAGYEVAAQELASIPSLTVLLADDKETNLEVARRMLENEGHQVFVARNGEEAFETALDYHGEIDLVLMDVNMPLVDGLEATKLIRAGEAGGDRCTIYGLTADITEDGVAGCMRAGMDGVLHKPLRQSELHNILQEVSVLKPQETPEQRPVQLYEGLKEQALPENHKRPTNAPKLVSDKISDNAAAKSIDLDRLEELQSLDPSGNFVAEIASTFFTDAMEIMAGTRAAVEARDVQQLQKMRHAMRSTAVSFGAVSIDQLCEKARAIDIDEIEAAGDKFIDALIGELRIVLDELAIHEFANLDPVLIEELEKTARKTG